MAKRWYVVNVYSGMEEHIKQLIHEQAAKAGMSSMIGEILVPMEKVIEIKKGEKQETAKQFFPGYVLVNMELTDDTWHLIRSIPRVAGFLGSHGKPQPISASEVERIVKKVEDSANNSRQSITYEIGDTVTVCDGPFASFQGVIDEIDQEKERVKVAVSIFGRSTNVDLSFSQIEKAL